MMNTNRTLVIAFNGTWNERKDAGEYNLNTNVVRLTDQFAKEDVFESDGVGTRYSWFGKMMGGAFGLGGKHRISEAYDWLVKNYEPVGAGGAVMRCPLGVRAGGA